jgi:hypothetical protein
LGEWKWRESKNIETVRIVGGRRIWNVQESYAVLIIDG